MGDGTVPSLDELRSLRETLYAVARRHKARRLMVFGSVARGEPSPRDVDILVELETDASLFDLTELQDELEELLGCPVDLGTPSSIKPRVRDRVMAEAVGL